MQKPPLRRSNGLEPLRSDVVAGQAPTLLKRKRISWGNALQSPCPRPSVMGAYLPKHASPPSKR